MAILFLVEWLLADHYEVPTAVSIVLLAGVLLVGLLGSLLTAYGERLTQLLPGTADIEHLVLYLWKRSRRVVVFILGATIVLLGIAMIVLPGPALIVIPLGLALLATEFVWARYLLNKFKETAHRVTGGLLPAKKEKTADKGHAELASDGVPGGVNEK